MSNARKLADNLPTEGSLSERNLVINGDMTIAQRSTSVSSQTGSGYKTVDRIYTNASGATYNQSQQTVTVGGETGLPLQFTKYLRHDVTTGDNWSQIYHKIEDVASVPEGTVTLSFYAKGTTPDSGLTVYCFQNFGSGGSGEVGISVSQTSTLTSTWQRFTVPITIPSITGKTIGTGSHFYFGIGQGGSTSTNAWTLDITGLMLEVGSQSTPFEHEPYSVTLAKCQRYFQHHQGRYYTIFLNGTKDSGSAYLSGSLSQVMRDKPSFSTANCYLYGIPSGVVSYTAAENRCNTSYATIGFTSVTGSIDAGEGVRFESNNNNGYVRYDAEL